MSPRSYKLGQRQAITEQTRTRILIAARELLIASNGFSSFSIDAVVRQADVARMTVYNQFGSKIGLLEALSDSLAAHGGMEQLTRVFRLPDPLDALDRSSVTSGSLIDSLHVDYAVLPHSIRTSSKLYIHVTNDDGKAGVSFVSSSSR